MNFKLILGYKCNMNCEYCYQKKFHNSNKNMSYEVINKFLERFNKLEGNHNINFFGGEPLIYIDKIKYIMDRIDKRHSISISTNASLRGVFYELEEYWGSNINNLLSNKEHKNYTKLNNLSGFRYVVSKENINELTSDLIEFLAKEYKTDLQFKYDMSKKWELKDIQKMEQVQRQLQAILGISYKIELPVDINSSFSCPYLKDETVIINYNGDYLKCHRNEKYILGNIFENEFKKVEALENCLDDYTNKKENLYSYGDYKFRGTTIFGCN